MEPRIAKARRLSASLAGGMALLALAGLATGCSTIRTYGGYVRDQTIVSTVQPGIDNRTSVKAALGDPSYESDFGQPVWYYVSSMSEQKPFSQPRIANETVTAVHFDANGTVTKVDSSGMERVARIDPDGAVTPTLGRERGLLEDLFGNIGQVGSADTTGVAGGTGGTNRRN